MLKINISKEAVKSAINEVSEGLFYGAKFEAVEPKEGIVITMRDDLDEWYGYSFQTIQDLGMVLASKIPPDGLDVLNHAHLLSLMIEDEGADEPFNFAINFMIKDNFHFRMYPVYEYDHGQIKFVYWEARLI